MRSAYTCQNVGLWICDEDMTEVHGVPTHLANRICRLKTTSTTFYYYLFYGSVTSSSTNTNSSRRKNPESTIEQYKTYSSKLCWRWLVGSAVKKEKNKHRNQKEKLPFNYVPFYFHLTRQQQRQPQKIARTNDK